MKYVIIGHGEVGRAFVELYNGNVEIVDPPQGFHGDPSGAAVAHICTPAAAVPEVLVQGALNIVHATVAPGTCRALSEKATVVHAPVKGKHPDLAESLLTFRMMVGGGEDDVVRAIDVLTSIGITATDGGVWENTEIAKVMSTTRLGLDALFIKHLHDLCEQYGADLEKVYAQWTKDYNDGYESMGLGKFRRPILRYMPGPIGGHCVMPNAELMKNESWIAREVSERGH